MRRIFKSLIVFVIVGGAAIALQYWLNSTSDDHIQNISADTARVGTIDGDSFRAGDDEIRLFGIDAPEYRQICKDRDGKNWPCGKRARSAMDAILKEGGLSCTARARDNYGRSIAICSTTLTANIAETLVHRGWAVSTGLGRTGFDNALGPAGEYDTAQSNAKAARRGIWRGTFQSPRQWRAEHGRNATKQNSK